MGIVIRDSRFLDLLCRLEITPTQFYLMYLLHTKNFAGIAQYTNEVAPFPNGEVEDLVGRGMLIDMNKDNGPIYADLLSLTDSAQTLLFKNIEQCGNEMWDAYPSFIMVNGAQVPAKTCDKDDIMDLYGDIIAYNPIYHRRVLELIAYAKNNGLISMGIEKWVKSRQWEAIESLISGDQEGERHGEKEL